MPDSVAIGDGGAVSEQAKALVAHAVKQLELDLLIAVQVQILQDQEAHHDRGGVWRASTLTSVTTGQQVIDDLREVPSSEWVSFDRLECDNFPNSVFVKLKQFFEEG